MADIRGISFITNFYSNIDIEEVLNKLMEVEKKPLNMMKDRVNSLTTKRNEWSYIKTDLISLKSLVYSIKQISFWNQKKGYSSDEKILNIRVDENALPTEYNITINSLATYSRREGDQDIGLPIDPNALLNQAGYSEEIKYGYFTINGVQIEVNETDTTNTILEKINNQIEGMTATYDSNEDKIILTYNGDIIIGSSNDSSNFLEVAKLSSGQNTVSSSTKLGVINLNATIENARLQTTPSSSGTFKINGIEFSYDSTDTLNSIIRKINTSNANVYAYYDSYLDRIVLLNKETGAVGIFVEDITGNLMSALQLTGNSNLILGQNASYIVEGFNNNQPIESKTNYNVKIANGVYVDFLNTGNVNIKIENDIDKIISQIKNFIQNYNNVFLKIREKSKIEIKGETIEKGSLYGETLLMDISINLRSKMSKIYSDLPTGFNNLVDFGINSDIKGIYTIKDETKLKNKIIENPENTKEFFTKLTTDIYSYLDILTKEGYGIYGGIISNRINTIDNEINRLNKDIKTFEERLKLIEERYWTSFIAMDRTISQLNSQLANLYYFSGLNINEKR